MTKHRALLFILLSLVACSILSAVLIVYFDEMILEKVLVPIINAYHTVRVRWSLVSEQLLWLPLVGLALAYLFRITFRLARHLPGHARARRAARIGEGQVPALARRIRRANASRFMRGRVLRELALTAARLVMRKEGCTFSQARRSIRQGSWTPDPVASRFLAARPRGEASSHGFASQLERTLDVLEAYQQEG